MLEGYVEIEGVRYDGRFPSGKAFRVVANSHFYSIPQFAVHEDSEIYLDTENIKGTLIIREDIAVEKGLVEAEPEGSGLVLKKLPRSRLTPPEYGLTEGQLKKLVARIDMLPRVRYASEGGGLFVGDKLIGATEGCRSFFLFAVDSPEIIERLAGEILILRAWAKKVCGA